MTGSFIRSAYHRITNELKPQFMTALEQQDQEGVEKCGRALQVPPTPPTQAEQSCCLRFAFSQLFDSLAKGAAFRLFSSGASAVTLASAHI